MSILTHCPRCNHAVGPRDSTCLRCGAPIPRQAVGTVLISRPIPAFLEASLGGHGTPLRVPLQSQVPLYTIGRGPGAGGNRVVLDSQAVAVAVDHARLRIDLRNPSLPLWRFEDLGSPNGSFRNNRRLHTGILDDGDEIWLGSVNGVSSVRLLYHDQIEKPPLKRWLLQPLGINPVQVGRDVRPGHLRLFSESASDQHATIWRVPSGTGVRYELSDAGSKNGTFVNQMRLIGSQRQVLKPGDAVRFGDCQYVVQPAWPMQLLLLPLGALADEHLVATGLSRTVRMDANIWLDEYLRFQARRLLRFRARSGGVQLAAPQRDKQLLHDVDVVVGPNDFVILAGSSGSGKTTLMHILSTVIYPQQGTLLYKGRPYKDAPKLLRPNMGYVPQDDIVHDQLTVYQELAYAAELRLPAALSAEERELRIHGVLKQLRLVPQTRQRISKLSGGQRKRVSIAVELLNRPGILFLDEPTEGQDLSLEQNIIILLRTLANEGTSVVLVSHRLNFLDYADYVGWLAPGGHLVYYGQPDQLAAYFGMNPSFTPSRRYAAIYDKLERERNPAQLADTYKRSPQYQEAIRSRQAGPGPGHNPLRPPGGNTATVRQGPLRQFRTLLSRNWTVARADWSFLFWMVIQAPLIGLLLSVLAEPNMFTKVQDSGDLVAAQQILFPLGVSAVWLGVFGSMRELVKERAIYRRERMVGLGLLPYLSSKIALLSLSSVYQSVVLLWLVLSKAPLAETTGVLTWAPLEMFITILLTSFGGMMLGLLLSAVARTQEVVGALVPLIVIPQFILSKALGFSLTGIMDVLAKLTFSYWTLEALGDSAHLNSQAGVPPGTPVADYDPTAAHLLFRWFMLIVLSLVMLALTWMRQRARDRYEG